METDRGEAGELRRGQATGPEGAQAFFFFLLLLPHCSQDEAQLFTSAFHNLALSLYLPSSETYFFAPHLIIKVTHAHITKHGKSQHTDPITVDV